MNMKLDVYEMKKKIVVLTFKGNKKSATFVKGQEWNSMEAKGESNEGIMASKILKIDNCIEMVMNEEEVRNSTLSRRVT